MYIILQTLFCGQFRRPAEQWGLFGFSVGLRSNGNTKHHVSTPMGGHNMTLHRMLSLGGVLLLILAALPVLSAAANPVLQVQAVQPLTSARLSTGISGETGGSYAAISASGRFVVFESHINGSGGSWEVFVHDRQSAQTEIASLRSDGRRASNPGEYTSMPAISADGRFVAFMSQASGLVSGDSSGMPDIFVRDRVSGTTELVTVALEGGPANGPSFTPAISADGRFVVFQSYASNLVKSDRNDSVDIFVRDRQLGVTELVSVTDAGLQGSDYNDYGFSSVSISADGRFIAFSYEYLPVVGQPGEGGSSVYIRDRQAKTTRRIAGGNFPVLSADGRYLVFVTSEALVPADQNGFPDVYVFDRGNNSFERVSISSSGAEAASQWIFCPPSISANGRLVAFQTTAALVPEDTNDMSDIYLRDRQAGQTILISSAPNGQVGNGESHYPALAADGSALAFTSTARNIDPADSDDRNDVFVRTLTSLVNATGENIVFLPVVIGR
jgi:Tol biopolymer transport system component